MQIQSHITVCTVGTSGNVFLCSYIGAHPDQIMRRDPSLDPSTNYIDFGPGGPSTVGYRHTTSLGYSSTMPYTKGNTYHCMIIILFSSDLQCTSIILQSVSFSMI